MPLHNMEALTVEVNETSKLSSIEVVAIWVSISKDAYSSRYDTPSFIP